MQELYIIRHCQAEGQEPNAPLTMLGQEQADRLAAQFDAIPLDVIISSPYLRAIQTIQPLAENKKLLTNPDVYRLSLDAVPPAIERIPV
ncbi:histidine phosphatase family protein [Paenibacillus sp. WLX1005]|uniref:histidine phosphatase family protein n=1 Tax=Paenibacillus sp. WLX1005 TaxID=3243766 RepID=UPI0039841847